MACSPALGYITNPRGTLEAFLNDTPIVSVFRVERVEKRGESEGAIFYRKQYDLKGRYPRETITQVFVIANIPGFQGGAADVPILPDARDWQHALAWAQPGKTAIFGAAVYGGWGNFGYAYLDGGWYCVMDVWSKAGGEQRVGENRLEAREFEQWHSINSDEALLTRWHGGTPAQLAVAIEQLAAGADKDAVVAVLAGGTREDLRQARAKVAGMWVGDMSGYVARANQLNAEGDANALFNRGSQVVIEALDRAVIPALIRGLRDPDRQKQRQAILTLGMVAAPADGAVAPLLGIVKESTGGLRLNALAAVAKIGVASNDAPLAAAVLAEAMKDRDSLVRRIAGHALGNLGEQARSAAAALAPMLPKAIGAGRLDFPEAMLRVDPANTEASRYLVGLFTNPQLDRETRQSAGDTLRLARKSSVPDLVRMLKDPDVEIRLVAVELLGRQGPAAKEAIVSLTDLVGKDVSPTVWARAATALASIGPDAKTALPVLKAAMSDPRVAPPVQGQPRRSDVVDEIGVACGKLQ